MNKYAELCIDVCIHPTLYPLIEREHEESIVLPGVVITPSGVRKDISTDQSIN